MTDKKPVEKKLSSGAQKAPRKIAVGGNINLEQANVISTDMGNGNNAAFVLKGGEIDVYSIPHGRMIVTGSGLESDALIKAKTIDWCEWRGVRYATGEDLQIVGNRIPETHRNDSSRYGGDLHIMSILLSLAKLGIDPALPATIVVPVPPGLVNEVTKTVKKNILLGESGQRDGKWTIALKGKPPVTYTIEKVLVIPEGTGAFAAYAFDVNGQVIQDNMMLNGRYILGGMVDVHDLGMGTADRLTIFNGDIAAESIKHDASDATGGIQYHMVQPILSYIREMTGAAHLTETHVDHWLRRWAIGGFKSEAATNTVGGKSIIMAELFRKHAEQYAQWFVSEKLVLSWRQGADTVLAAGGGWVYIQNRVRQLLSKERSERLLFPSDFVHLHKVPVYSLNGYGGLILVAKVLQNA